MKQGTVVDTRDPLMQGRYKIRLDKGHQNIKDTDLPWIHLPFKSFEILRNGDRIRI